MNKLLDIGFENRLLFSITEPTFSYRSDIIGGMAKPTLKARAVTLRKAGYSYNLIQKELSVAKSTLSDWLSDIPYTPNEKVRNRIKGAWLKSKEWHRKNKKKSLDEASKEAIEELGVLSRRDLFMLGLGLYIGEGTKTNGHVRIINSDPQVINLAIRWFEDVLGLTTKNFHLDIHLYPDNNVREALNFWSEITGISLKQFGKTQIDRRRKKPSKRGTLRYGTAHLRIICCGNKRHGVFLFRKILALIEEANRQIN